MRTLLLALLIALPASTWAQTEADEEGRPRLIDVPQLSPQEQFRLCMTQATASPAAALIEAERWELEGGGNLARECAATALANDNAFAAAARRFEALGRELAEIDPEYASDLYREAGRLWLREGFAQRAVWVLESASELVEVSPQLLVERARARHALDDDAGALEDLTQAAELAPDRPDLLALRASALRRLNMNDEAVDDLTRAIEVGGDFAELTLERGIVRVRQGDSEGARLDFQSVLDEAPDSISAEIARREIERLDHSADAS
ncbi:MAG: hypothetical protein AAF414_16200 [Pseudomonadota bacterium]